MHPLPVDLGSEFGLGLVQYFREGCAKFFDVDRWSCHGRTLAPLRNGPSVRPTAIEGRSPPFASDDRSSHPILGGLVGTGQRLSDQLPLTGSRGTPSATTRLTSPGGLYGGSHRDDVRSCR